MERRIEDKGSIIKKSCTSTGAKAKMKGYLALLPKFFGLIVNLLRDPRVSASDKAILGATIAYLLNPVDLVPDWIPFLGLVDDVYLIALALLRLVLRTDEKILQEYWTGPDELVPLLKQIADWAVAFLPARIRRALLARVDTD